MSTGTRERKHDTNMLKRAIVVTVATVIAFAATQSIVAQGSASDNSDREIDLREANVVGVEVSSTGNQYRFDVTLIHDDEGESGYANWWQVETLAGEQLGRRTLLHAHGTREFTRSETISIPNNVTRVVVRGHDQTHGYGGQAMIVVLETGETSRFRQGSERQDASE